MKLSVALSVLVALFVASTDAWRPPCDKTCVIKHWKHGHKCPHYCEEKKCYKDWKKGVQCVPTPKPSPSPYPLPHGCAKVCVPAPIKYGYKCPHYCNTRDCRKDYKKGIKCVPTPKPSPSPYPLPDGCAKVCVPTPLKYGYKCPHYCNTRDCYKDYKKGIKCVPTPKPSPSPYPLPDGCAKVCVPTPLKYGYKCPHYCKTQSCHKDYKKGIKCMPKSPCPDQCVSWPELNKQGCDELKCHVQYCKTEHYKTRYVKCSPLH